MEYSLGDLMDARDKKELSTRLQAKKRVITLGNGGTEKYFIKDSIRESFVLAENSVMKQHAGFIFRGSGYKIDKKWQFPPAGVYHPKAIPRLPVIATVLRQIENNISKNVVSTFRDVYYRNTELFGNQKGVVEAVDQIQRMYNIRNRLDLNIRAAQKGLIYSPFTIAINNSTYNQCAVISADKSELIPNHDYDTCTIRLNCPEESKLSVLVLEKEAVYNNVIQLRFQNTVIVTGKGYPDILTRDFLARLHQDNPKVSITILTDADPYGISIALKYIQCFKNNNVNYIARQGVSILDLLDTQISSVAQVLRLEQRAIRISQKLVSQDLPSNMKLELQRQLFFMKKGEMNTKMNVNMLSKYINL
ncbi:Meiosis-specific protein SPO11 [Nakaseomyces bracarensis]|uniref:DNA topoisomerase (ATP-hydrolyzing) n=1 Tax=Nakaseomyces bracarensis TaxID=273131 RepID=A0ABR4NST3_9SACH